LAVPLGALLEQVVVGPEQPLDLVGVRVERGIGQRDLQHRTDLPLQTPVLPVGLVLEAVSHAQVVVLVGEDAEFLLETLLGGLELALALHWMGGDGAVPAGAPEALLRGALAEQDSARLVEHEGGERAVALAVAGVGVEAVCQPLLAVVFVDGDDLLAGVGVALGLRRAAGRVGVLGAHARVVGHHG
jgi:hypothetical protein